LLQEETQKVTVKRFPVMTVARVYEAFAEEPRVLRYLPDRGLYKREPNREFVFTVVHVIEPAYMNRIVAAANAAREVPRSMKAD
jgi:hypothetical protein